VHEHTKLPPLSINPRPLFPFNRQRESCSPPPPLSTKRVPPEPIKKAEIGA